MQNVVRLVIDTVGFVRAVLYPNGAWGALLFEYSSRYELLTSNVLDAEIQEVFERPFLREKIGSLYDLRTSRVLGVLENAEHVPLMEIPSVSRDKDDDHVVATAVGGHADYIATEDKDLLDMSEYQGIGIVTGVELLRILRT